MAFATLPAFLLLPHAGPAAIPLAMLVVFISAKFMAELAERIGQPGIVGEIVAGVLVGPSVLGWLAAQRVPERAFRPRGYVSCSSASASK